MENNLNKVKKIRNRAKRLSRRVMSFTLVLISVVSLAAVPAKKVDAVSLSKGGSLIIDAVKSGAMEVGSSLGGGFGLGSIVGLGLDFFNTLSGSSEDGNLSVYNYYGGDTYNTTINYNIANDYTKNYSILTEYDYSFYNPVNNTYNYMNDYSYNPTYNTYYYTVNNTNYYVTDNTTYVSYYIVDNSSDVPKESYYEIYYQLPDGRNSYNLTKEDIWGQYFIYDFTNYKNVPEDDGTTLGLWHLDGDLKDSSVNNNSAGSSYVSDFRDGRFSGGIYLSDNDSEFLKLNLDNVDLPGSWTLEWIQYIHGKEPSTTGRMIYYTEGGELRRETAIEYYAGYDNNEYNVHIPPMKGSIYVYYNAAETLTTHYYNGVCGLDGSNIYFTFPTDSFVPCALVCDNGSYSFYSNGIKQDITDGYSGGGLSIDSDYIEFHTVNDDIAFTGEYGERSSEAEQHGLISELADDKYNYYRYVYVRSRNQIKYYSNQDTIIDEVRLSKGVLYTDNYTPSVQPFSTNMALVVPDDASENQVAFKSEYKVNNARFGGVRPTYPFNGDVFVDIEDDVVKSVQQYQENGWYEIDGAIYRNGKWEQLKNFDMTAYVVNEPDGDNTDLQNPENPEGNGGNDNQGSGGNTDNDNNDDNDSKSIWDRIADLITALFGAVSKILGAIIEGLTTLVTNITDALGSLSDLTGEFGDFLKAIFVFIPDEIIDVLILGVTLCVFAAVIKIFI